MGRWLVRIESLALICSALGIATPAARAADDRPERAAGGVSAEGDRWSGAYARIGFGFNDARNDVTASVNRVGLDAGGAFRRLNDVGSPEIDDGAASGGFAAGYRWQRGSVVWGLEVEFNASAVDGRASTTYSCPTYGGGVCTFSQRFKSDLVTTVLPRVGLVLDRFMVSAALGPVLARWETRDRLSILAAPRDSYAARSELSLGWAAAIGLEYWLDPRWRLGPEYMYADMGKLRTAAPEGAFGGLDNHIRYRHRITNSLTRMSLTYYFGGE
jgi:outer membrane immunogenic protein